MSRACTMSQMDEAARAGRLALQVCANCGSTQYPPRELCVVCLSTQLNWQVHDWCEAVLLATSTLHHSQEPDFQSKLPLRIGTVRLADGAFAVCFVPKAESGARVRVRAGLDAKGRAVLTAETMP